MSSLVARLWKGLPGNPSGWLAIFLSVYGAGVVPAAAQQTESKETQPKEQEDPCGRTKFANGGEISEFIVGFQQAGASSAKSDQSYFLDFFGSEPIPVGKYPCDGGERQFFGPRARWWGNVRLASYPQQINAPVGQFVSDFANQVANVPVNKLVHTAEFIAGVEYRVAQFQRPLNGTDQEERQQFGVSVFGGIGASSPLEPNDTLQIFETPEASSAQRAAFVNAYPQAANTKYVGFLSPDRDRFLRQFSIGLRLTTIYAKRDRYGRADLPYLRAPAMISVSLGRNEVVTGGHLEGVVNRVEGFYPLVLNKDRSGRAMIVYLFGSAFLRVGGAHQIAPLILKPADDSVHGYDPGVTLITAPSNRDTYMVGAGIDVTQLLKQPAGLFRR
jgi:hypothetical protein